ncbi:MAG: BamA/TamA family outer membrane protein [Prolixibacteraceae bacterium]
MRTLFRAITLSLLTAFCSHTLLSAQENYEIRQVNFKGNTTLDDDVLLEGMAIKEVSYLEKLITKKEPSLFSQDLIELDVQRVIRIYQSEGFLDVKANLRPLKINDKKKTVKITIDIEEGEFVKVDSISVKTIGEAAKTDTDSLMRKTARKLLLSKEERFRDQSLNTDVQLIRDAYRNLGYAYSVADYGLDLRPEQRRVSIGYSVTPGPVCSFGETLISGNKHVSEKFLRKQLKYDEGELYNKFLLDETRQNFYRLQLFRIVSVLPESDAKTKRNPIPVKIQLEEAPRISTRFGVGYGTEDKFRAFVDLNYLSFLNTASRLNLYLKHSALEPYYLSLKWIFPQFPVNRSSMSFNPFVSRNSEPGYETRSYGINIPASYVVSDWLSGTLTYYLEDVKQQIEEGDVEFPDMEKEDFPYFKSGILLNVLLNNSEPKFSPEKGISFMMGFKLNGHFFGSDFNYTRLWADFRNYHDIGKLTLAFRAMAGGIKSADESGFIPVEDRFYSGGSNSVRGWNRSKLGPKRESGTPMGGKSIVEGSVELRYPLFWKLSGVAFLDAGNVWTKSYSYRLNDLAYATGPGIRIETPIGPIRFDVGFPVWNEKKSPQFFISVGQAF